MLLISDSVVPFYRIQIDSSLQILQLLRFTKTVHTIMSMGVGEGLKASRRGWGVGGGGGGGELPRTFKPFVVMFV